jgi:hypothetical protein
VNKYNFFVLEVVKAWIDKSIENPRTLHHQGKGVFMVAGDTIKLPSKMKLAATVRWRGGYSCFPKSFFSGLLFPWLIIFQGLVQYGHAQII